MFKTKYILVLVFLVQKIKLPQENAFIFRYKVLIKNNKRWNIKVRFDISAQTKVMHPCFSVKGKSYYSTIIPLINANNTSMLKNHSI